MMATNLIIFIVALISQLLLQTNSFVISRSAPSSCVRTAPFILQAAVVDAEDLMYLTPIQTKQLRKETSQRRARKTLKQISFDDFDEESFPEFLQQLTDELATEGLVEVRGISKHRRRDVHQIAEEIAEESGEILTTFLVTVKGHAAVYFTPIEAIPVRTTGKRNEWTKRDKAERDERGQIVQ